MAVRETVLKVTPDTRSIAETRKQVETIDAAVKSLGNTAQEIKPRIQQTGAELVKLAKTGKLDSESIEEAAARLKSLGTQAQDARNELEKTRAGLEGLEGAELDKQNAKVARLEESYTKLQRQIAAIPRGLQDAIDKQDELDRKARSLSSTFGEGASRAQQRIGGLGNVDTALGTLGGFVGGGGGEALQAAGQVSAATEQIVLMGEGALATGRKVAEGSNLLGTMAQTATALVPGLGAAGGGLLALGAAVAPIALVAGGAVLAFKALSDAQERVRESTERLVALERSRAENQAEVQFLLMRGDREGALNILAAQDEEYTKGLIQQGIIRQRLAEAEARLAEELEKNRGNESAIEPEALRQARSDVKGFQEDLAKFDEAFIPLTISLFDTAAALGLVDRAAGLTSEGLDTIRTAAEGTRQETEGLTEAQKAAARAEEERTRTLERAQSVLTQLAEQEAQVLRNAQLQRTQLIEDRKLRDTRELEDYKETIDRGFERIATVREQGSKRIEQIEVAAANSTVKAIEKAGATEIKTRQDTGKRVEQVETNFAKESLKREAQFNKERLRSSQDLRDTLFDAQIANDILSITLAKRNAKKEEARRKEDFDEEAKERTTARGDRILEIREEGRIRIEEIKAQLGEEKRQIETSLRERTDAELKGIDERIAAEEKAQTEADRQRDKRLRRQAEDEQIADRRREQALQMQLDDIDKRRDQEIAALDEIGIKATNIRSAELLALENVNAAVIRIRQSAAMIDPGVTSTRTAAADNRPIGSSRPIPIVPLDELFDEQRRRAIPFQEGGIVRKGVEVLGRFERERPYDEAVLPLTPRHLAQYFPQGFGGGTQHIEINITGSGVQVTKDDVRQAFMLYAAAENKGRMNARRGSVA